MKALLGIKIGMTQIFDDAGRVIPVTAIEAGPCVVTSVKTSEKDGYEAVVLGLGKKKHPNHPEIGRNKELKHTPQYLKEFRTNEEAPAVGTVLTCSEWQPGDVVRLVGTSKGKGFAGVIKRHHFHRGPQTHGSDHHRAPGSIGSMFPQHVIKGHRMPGKMGGDQVTVRKVQIVEVNPDQNVILVKGPVPGSPGTLVEISLM